MRLLREVSTNHGQKPHWAHIGPTLGFWKQTQTLHSVQARLLLTVSCRTAPIAYVRACASARLSHTARTTVVKERRCIHNALHRCFVRVPHVIAAGGGTHTCGSACTTPRTSARGCCGAGTEAQRARRVGLVVHEGAHGARPRSTFDGLQKSHTRIPPPPITSTTQSTCTQGFAFVMGSYRWTTTKGSPPSTSIDKQGLPEHHPAENSSEKHPR